MFEKDYIMREVQKMVQVLTVILGLKRENKFDEALNEIENAYRRFFKENRTTIQSSDVDGLKQLCTKDGDFSPDLAFALADIIKVEADILGAKENKDKARTKYRLALKLYQSAVAKKDAAVPINIMDKIEDLRAKADKKIQSKKRFRSATTEPD